jgi:hypothetical protein
MHNLGKLAKHGRLVLIVWGTFTGHIGNVEIYTEEDKELGETIFSVLET